MQLLVFLHRFDLDLRLVKKKISSFGKNVDFVEENKVLLVLGDKLDVPSISSLAEVEKVLNVVSTWKALTSSDLREAASAVKGKYKVVVKLDVPDVSSKSIYKAINSVAKGFDEEDYDSVVYVEVAKKGGKKHFRLSIAAKGDWERENLNAFEYPFVIALESPTLVSEVSDFLRACWVFKTPLMLFGEVDKNIIDKAREDTKNVPRDFKVLVSKSLPKNIVKLGFSKNGSNGENELIGSIKKGKFVLVFGNEKFGLSQKSRDDCDALFSLGSGVSKPLRGSQALSYVLGIFRGLR